MTETTQQWEGLYEEIHGLLFEAEDKFADVTLLEVMKRAATGDESALRAWFNLEKANKGKLEADHAEQTVTEFLKAIGAD